MHAVLGDVKPLLEVVALPRMQLGQLHVKAWTPAEDNLLWLGIIRWVVTLARYSSHGGCGPSGPFDTVRHFCGAWHAYLGYTHAIFKFKG